MKNDEKVFGGKNKIIFFFIFLFSFVVFNIFAYEQDADKIARALAERLTVKYYEIMILNHSEISMQIDIRKGEAYIYSMGHELFRMKAKYVDFSNSKISIAKNWIELKGNGWDRIFLDVAKKILFFRHLNERGKWVSKIFAKVSISSSKNSNIIDLRIVKHKPIRIDLFTKYKQAWVYFDNFEMFIMHAKKIKIQGSSSIVRLKYMNKYRDGVYINFSRKILYFRSGIKGIFAKIKYKRSSAFVGDRKHERLYRIFIKKNADLSMKIDMRKGGAYIYSMGHELFRMKAKYVDFSNSKISIAKNWIELKGNGRVEMYLDIMKKVLFFEDKFKQEKCRRRVFGHVMIKTSDNSQIINLKIMARGIIRIDLLPAYKKAIVYFDNKELFIMHVKKIKIKGSSLPIFQLKYMNRYKDGVYFNSERRILYFRSKRKGVFAYVDYDILTW